MLPSLGAKTGRQAGEYYVSEMKESTREARRNPRRMRKLIKEADPDVVEE
jgi:hypothetical protein